VKTFFTFCLGLALVTLSGSRSYGEPPKAAATKAPTLPPRSVFTQPATQREGRDPFFPESTRVMDSVVAATHAMDTTTTLTVKGYSVVNGHPMVIINNHSFMTGDEGDVLSGTIRAHVHCLDIQPGTVVVEVNGARKIIHF
jgi:hypothetical protein